MGTTRSAPARRLDDYIPRRMPDVCDQELLSCLDLGSHSSRCRARRGGIDSSLIFDMEDLHSFERRWRFGPIGSSFDGGESSLSYGGRGGSGHRYGVWRAEPRDGRADVPLAPETLVFSRSGRWICAGEATASAWRGEPADAWPVIWLWRWPAGRLAAVAPRARARRAKTRRAAAAAREALREARGGAPVRGRARRRATRARAAGRRLSSSVNLDGSPIYTRVQRLTVAQWERAVTDILRFAAPANLSERFQVVPAGTTDFTNNEKLLFVDHQAALDFEAGSEAAAALATGTPEALARLYAGTDAAGFVSTLRAPNVSQTAHRRRADEVRSRLFIRGTTLRRGFRERARRSCSARCCSRRTFSTARSSGPRASRSTATRRRRSFRSGYSAPRRATRCSTPPPPVSSGRPTGCEGVAREMLEQPAAVDVMRDFHGQAFTSNAMPRSKRPAYPSTDEAVSCGGSRKLRIDSSIACSKRMGACARS